MTWSALLMGVLIAVVIALFILFSFVAIGAGLILSHGYLSRWKERRRRVEQIDREVQAWWGQGR